MSWFLILTLCGWVTVVIAAFSLRGRRYATFVGVVVGIYSLVAVAVVPAFVHVLPVFAALHGAVYLNFAMLARPRMRGLPYRLLVSWPASFFAAGTLLALPWAVLTVLGFHPWGPWLPYALAAIGLVQSLTARREEVDLVVDGPGGVHAEKLAPHPRGSAREERPLRIVQISRSAPRPVHVGRAPPAHRPSRGGGRAGFGPLDRRFSHHGIAGRSRSPPDGPRAPPSDEGARLRVPR
jgi:hypothetical protein